MLLTNRCICEVCLEFTAMPFAVVEVDEDGIPWNDRVLCLRCAHEWANNADRDLLYARADPATGRDWSPIEWFELTKFDRAN